MLLGLLVAALIAAPVLILLAQVFTPSEGVWAHLAETVLADYIANSLILMAGVAALTLVFGVAAAWLVTMTQWRGSRVFEWALLLPLAFPAYVLAYVYYDFLSPGGRLSLWFLVWGWPPEWGAPVPIAGLGAATILLASALYPYVYLMARTAFLEQSVCVLDVSRTLGCGPWRQFFRVGLPLARPGIAAGLALVMMETAAEYGLVQHLGVPTFTVGIFRTWYGLGSPVGAAQLASLLLGFMALLLAFERASRGQARFHATTERRQPLSPRPLRGWRAGLAFAVCALPLTVGFILPAIALLALFAQHIDMRLGAEFWDYARNSLILASGAAVLSLALALLLGYGRRLSPHWGVRAMTRVATWGYAVPGAVVAVGILIFFGSVNRALAPWWGDGQAVLALGSVTALLYAYVVRFLAVGMNGVEAGMQKIRPALDDAARSLGQSPAGVLAHVHAPLLRGSLLGALLLLFVDVLKELPATLILRPFGFDTLAVRVHQLASDERLAQASGAALAIVLVGLIPVILLSQLIRRSRAGQEASVVSLTSAGLPAAQ